MTPTLIDLVKLLMSRGLSPETSLETAAEVDRMFGITARASGSSDEQREKWRLKKQRQRNVPGDKKAETTTLNLPKLLLEKVKKKSPVSPDVPLVPGDNPAPADDWPGDFAEQFWDGFPPFRRESRRKVAEKLARIRRDGRVPWLVLFDGLRRYAASDPGQYACAPMVWLNNERWDRVYGAGNSNGDRPTGGSRGGGSSPYLAAARRRVVPTDRGDSHASGSAATNASGVRPGADCGGTDRTIDLSLEGRGGAGPERAVSRPPRR